MAAVQPARTRSTRAHLANTAKPLLQPPAVASSSASSAQTGTSSIPPLSIFLRNVTLLNLDTLPDWPGLTAATFATPGNGTQGQKKRVQCVEWALFQLFMIWDAQLARDKLKPFFPPLDQVQSTNLRAALLRALEQAKKNGILGRDALIRKTMLDDCKGERLEEVLAAFSSAVLKKVITDETAEHGDYTTPVLSIALEARNYKGDTTDLQVLGLAHKAALHSVLRQKATADRRFKDFANLLDVKEKKLHRRTEEMHFKREEEADVMTEVECEELSRMVRNNWTGNEHWMDALVYGDAGSAKDNFTDMGINRIWRRVEQDRLSELEESGTGLLEQLDTRIRVQKERMQKWDAFRRRMFGNQAMVSPSKQKSVKPKKKKGVDMGFTTHERLQFGSVQPRTLSVNNSGITSDYIEFIGNLNAELDEEGKTVASLDFLKDYRPQRDHSLSPATTGEEAISELSEFTEEDEEDPDEIYQSPIRPFSARLEGAKRLPVRPKLSHPDDGGTPRKASSGSPFRRPVMDEDDEDGDETIKFEFNHQSDSASQRTATTSRSRSPIKRRSPSPQPSLSPEPPSPTQQAANQIIDSMDTFSPSPIKRPRQRPTLSLADRARLSMARGSSAFLDQEDEPELPTPTMTTSTTNTDNTLGTEQITEEPQDLAARTRKSMAGFEKAVQKAHMERRRSQRISKVPPRREGSIFPATVNEEAAQEERGILAEELMAEEDMEAVFRSRPKIAASPLRSPTKGWEDEGGADSRWR